ncbi:uncharacterized protein LOC124132909 [Haliotis rufescens]|uniref:uncharacterized protein LOC124132909 n=1 Tax=Haliotis rufescens TaxID=6454 RepID=UPI00201E856B|nr:uncharacterized protein LOC124132909 [Haliotis rufescens]XP_046353027.2 uncharacterized protein LOC124132909 [Haliotis rufescens]
MDPRKEMNMPFPQEQFQALRSGGHIPQIPARCKFPQYSLPQLDERLLQAPFQRVPPLLPSHSERGDAVWSLPHLDVRETIQTIRELENVTDLEQDSKIGQHRNGNASFSRRCEKKLSQQGQQPGPFIRNELFSMNRTERRSRSGQAALPVPEINASTFSHAALVKPSKEVGSETGRNIFSALTDINTDRSDRSLFECGTRHSRQSRADVEMDPIHETYAPELGPRDSANPQCKPYEMLNSDTPKLGHRKNKVQDLSKMKKIKIIWDLFRNGKTTGQASSGRHAVTDLVINDSDVHVAKQRSAPTYRDLSGQSTISISTRCSEQTETPQAEVIRKEVSTEERRTSRLCPNQTEIVNAAAQSEKVKVRRGTAEARSDIERNPTDVIAVAGEYESRVGNETWNIESQESPKRKRLQKIKQFYDNELIMKKTSTKRHCTDLERNGSGVHVAKQRSISTFSRNVPGHNTANVRKCNEKIASTGNDNIKNGLRQSAIVQTDQKDARNREHIAFIFCNGERYQIVSVEEFETIQCGQLA